MQMKERKIIICLLGLIIHLGACAPKNYFYADMLKKHPERQEKFFQKIAFNPSNFKKKGTMVDSIFFYTDSLICVRKRVKFPSGLIVPDIPLRILDSLTFIGDSIKFNIPKTADKTKFITNIDANIEQRVNIIIRYYLPLIKSGMNDIYYSCCILKTPVAENINDKAALNLYVVSFGKYKVIGKKIIILPLEEKYRNIWYQTEIWQSAKHIDY
jgi:hypothetical protein